MRGEGRSEEPRTRAWMDKMSGKIRGKTRERDKAVMEEVRRKEEGWYQM